MLEEILSLSIETKYTRLHCTHTNGRRCHEMRFDSSSKCVEV